MVWMAYDHLFQDLVCIVQSNGEDKGASGKVRHFREGEAFSRVSQIIGGVGVGWGGPNGIPLRWAENGF